MISNLVDLPHDLKWTNIAGTQLPTGHAELQVAGGQPHLVSRLIEVSWGTPSICEDLVTPHCPLEVDVG